MNTETIEHKGYKIEIATDDSPENPFESWDCEPPLLTYYGGRHGYVKTYQNAPSSWWDILRLLPDSVWTRVGRVAFYREFIAPLGVSVRDYVEERQRVGDVDAVAEYLCENLGAEPTGWGSAVDWFEMAESLLKFAGIACLNTESTGYSQGDSTLVLAIATPAWLRLTGVSAENAPSQLEGAVDLYSAWAWGDVYGIASITSPDGEELDHGSVWGFYGSDHEESGLLESARDSIENHIRDTEETALNEPACLI